MGRLPSASFIDEDPGAIAHRRVDHGRLEAIVDHLLAGNDLFDLFRRAGLLPVEHAGDVRVSVIERQEQPG